MKLNDKIRIIRKQRGLSQTELGYLLKDSGVSRQAISNWENGVFEPKLENIKDIATALNVSIDALVDDDLDLSNPSVLQSVLNNDYKNDLKHKSPIYVKLNRSYKILYMVLGVVICAAFLALFFYSRNLVNQIQISEVEAPGEATNILGGLQALQEYVVKVSARDKELQDNMITLFQFISYTFLALSVSFVLTFVVISIKGNRAIGMMSQNNLVLYKRKPIYVSFDDILSIEKHHFGIKVKTKEKDISIGLFLMLMK